MLFYILVILLVSAEHVHSAVVGQIIGCYADSYYPAYYGDLPYGGYSGYSTSTQLLCAQYCASKNYPYAAARDSTDCWCNYSYGIYGPSIDCNTACAGDSSKMCGGAIANTVMYTGVVNFNQIQSDPSPLGCYIDHSASHDMPDGYLSLSGTGYPWYSCLQNCMNTGYTYAGVYNGTSCYCGNAYGRYGPSSTGCSPCSVNANKMCGGPNAVSIYVAELDFAIFMIG